MKRTILVVGLACLSIVAMAQSNSDNKKAPASSSTQAAREASTGMATGRTGDPVKTPRDIATGQSSGKLQTTGQTVSPRDTASGQASGRVVKGDVNGDGKVDQANANASVHATAQPASAQTPKEVSTGKATGGKSAIDDWASPKAKVAAPATATPATNPQEQRMHKPVTISK